MRIFVFYTDSNNMPIPFSVDTAQTDTMKKIILSLFCLPLFLLATAQINTNQLAGVWTLKSVKFKGAIDLNKDGVKSEDAYDEYSDCEKDQQLELSADKSAKTYFGSSKKDCKAQVQSYTWQTKEQNIKDVQYENGKRVVTEKKATLLRLKDPEDIDSPVFIVISVSKKELVLKGEIRDGSDSTSPAVIVYKRQKK